MKASELIEDLKDLIQIYGDKEVLYEDENNDYMINCVHYHQLIKTVEEKIVPDAFCLAINNEYLLP